MVTARRKGMTNGDYVFIASTISDIVEPDYWWRGIGGTFNESEAKEAWHSVLTLVPRPYNITKYRKFQDQVVTLKHTNFPIQTNYTHEKVQSDRRLMFVKLIDNFLVVLRDTLLHEIFLFEKIKTWNSSSYNGALLLTKNDFFFSILLESFLFPINRLQIITPIYIASK